MADVRALTRRIRALELALEASDHGNFCLAKGCSYRWNTQAQSGELCGRERESHDDLRHNFHPRGRCGCHKAVIATTPSSGASE